MRKQGKKGLCLMMAAAIAAGTLMGCAGQTEKQKNEEAVQNTSGENPQADSSSEPKAGAVTVLPSAALA